MLRLSEIVMEVVPLEANERSIVASRFEKDREENDPFRDQNFLRKKFDKLVTSKNNTGDASFPEQVRASKHASWYIFGRASADKAVYGQRNM